MHHRTTKGITRQARTSIVTAVSWPVVSMTIKPITILPQRTKPNTAIRFDHILATPFLLLDKTLYMLVSLAYFFIRYFADIFVMLAESTSLRNTRNKIFYLHLSTISPYLPLKYFSGSWLAAFFASR